MSLISARQLSLHFGGLLILDNADVQLEERERICLVGRNGAGKSTLLKVLAGIMRPDSGIVEHRQGLRIGILPQEIPDMLTGTAFDIVSAEAFRYIDESSLQTATSAVEAVLSRLLVDRDMEFSKMSGGMKRRVMLAKALASEPDVLLLDEPTNHLDIDSIQWLESFLVRQPCALLFISHDRAFADNVSTKIIELDRGIITSFSGGYSEYVKHKAAALEIEARTAEKFDKKLASEESWIRQGIKARRTRNEGRVRALEKMREEKRARLSSAGSVTFSSGSVTSHVKRVIIATDVSFSYGSTHIVKNFETVIQRGDKIGIIGKNGTGKTTLLRLLLGEISPNSGEIKHGRFEAAYLDQFRDAIDDEATLIENLIGKGDTVEIAGKPRHVIGYLQDFLFSKDAANSPAKMLSGGERNRLMLAKLFTKKADMLVLDEPTNDLDTDTLELLESLLVSYDGTVLLVSHDRAFLNNVVTGTLVFEGDGRVTEYAGGYDDWLLQSKTRVSEALKPEKLKEKREKPRDAVRKLTFKEKQELTELPGKIEVIEEELNCLREQMSDAGFYQQDKDTIKLAMERMVVLEPMLEDIYARWEELESIAK